MVFANMIRCEKCQRYWYWDELVKQTADDDHGKTLLLICPDSDCGGVIFFDTPEGMITTDIFAPSSTTWRN